MAAKRKKTLTERYKKAHPQAAALAELRQAMGVAPDGWEAIVVGDGSGNDLERVCGWGSLLYQRDQPVPFALYGGLSNGTNVMAEVLAIKQPLEILVRRKRAVKAGGLLVHVATDSQYVARTINELTPERIGEMKANSDLWMGVLGAKRRGLRLVGHHIPRDTLIAQKLCHNLANIARRAQEGLVTKLGQEDLRLLMLDGMEAEVPKPKRKRREK